VSPLYALAARSPFVTPWVIAPASWDARIPLVPAAAIFYLTYFLLLPALIYHARRRPELPRVFATALVCGTLNVALYLAIPTRLAARPAAPAGTLLAILQRLDTPLCALPSGHVALPMSIAMASLLAARGARAQAWRRTAAAFFTWTLLLAAAALLTGQHYFVDILAGLGLGTVVAVAMLGVTAKRPLVHWPSALALTGEWAVILLTAAAALAWWNPWTALLAALVIATRQHALFVLYHDAVHGLIARPRRLNDFVINTAVGVPLLLPVHLYRALHISHHRHLGTPYDPERVLLYRGQRWSYRPLPAGALAMQLAGDLSGWNSIVMSWRYLVEQRRGGALRLPRTRAYPELAVQFILFAALWAGAVLLWPAIALRLAALWFIPYLTLTQMLQKVRSFAEHTDDEGQDDRSCSWAPGLAGRLTIWPYNINYHREHHARPDVPWNRLPAAFPQARQRPGADLRSHLWIGARR
jgi:fatty acid desaturase/membrane-associated phospholipid phosphatase